MNVGDHIRSMTDVELAALLQRALDAGSVHNPRISVAPNDGEGYPLGMLEWLERPYIDSKELKP